tara:strand:- start:498 stop:644 length:147 start_codon:yes stop_codon:yes gene_type:complete
MAELKEQIRKRVWDEYLQVKGGDFPNWYSGLSPIEIIIFKEVFREKQA